MCRDWCKIFNIEGEQLLVRMDSPDENEELSEISVKFTIKLEGVFITLATEHTSIEGAQKRFDRISEENARSIYKTLKYSLYNE